MNTTDRAIVLLPSRRRGEFQAARSALTALLPSWTQVSADRWTHPDGGTILVAQDTGDVLPLAGFTADIVALWPGVQPVQEVLREATIRTMRGRRPGTVVRLVLGTDEPLHPKTLAMLVAIKLENETRQSSDVVDAIQAQQDWCDAGYPDVVSSS